MRDVQAACAVENPAPRRAADSKPAPGTLDVQAAPPDGRFSQNYEHATRLLLLSLRRRASTITVQERGGGPVRVRCMIDGHWEEVPGPWDSPEGWMLVSQLRAMTVAATLPGEELPAERTLTFPASYQGKVVRCLFRMIASRTVDGQCLALRPVLPPELESPPAAPGTRRAIVATFWWPDYVGEEQIRAVFAFAAPAPPAPAAAPGPGAEAPAAAGGSARARRAPR